MQNVVLTEQEWQQVMGCMSYAPGRECIPLLNKMGEQLRKQANGLSNLMGLNNPEDTERRRDQ